MKLIGYILAIAGAIAVAASSLKEIQAPIFQTLKITSSPVYENYLFYGGIVLAIIGIFIIMKFSRRGRKGIKAGTEVPIYRGNQIVGYRRG